MTRLNRRVEKLETDEQESSKRSELENRTLDDFYRESRDPSSDTAKVNNAFYDPDRGCKNPSEVLNR